ncbi:hypothetical protein LCGC14_2399130, partial [marine sediment metagenome]
QYTWRFYVDGEVFGDFNFQNNVNNISQAYFFTYWGDFNYRSYIDAVGYSWDPAYAIGDNLNEGLLLSFETFFTPDWLGYSLDGQPNKTILGNTTISMPSEGLHTIQVFGNDSFGTMYESDVRYFTIDMSSSINVITPENKTYNAPMSGYYPATYGFENDDDGSDPEEWNVLEGGGTCNIIPSAGNHSKVVELNDNSAGDRVFLNQTFIGQSFGTFEFWWRIDDATKSIAFSAWNGGTWVLSLVLDNNIFKYWDSGWQNTGKSSANNTWYHVRIDFESTTGGYQGLAQYKWNMYIDGMLYGDFNLINNEGQIDMVNFNTNTAYTNYKAYIDAIDFSRDSNYNIGDNLNEGLLLSYENSAILEWQSYSLDGQPNRTILGNITIPMPSEGSHTIQVFGNDSIGTMHKSDLRYFETNTPPLIEIHSPNTNEYFGNLSPNFNVSIIDYFDLNTTWYTLDGGTTNITFSNLIDTIDQSEWDKLGNGTVIIRFYANDSKGLLGFTEVIIRKDLETPIVTINSPGSTDIFGYTAPGFNISINEP